MVDRDIFIREMDRLGRRLVTAQITAALIQTKNIATVESVDELYRAVWREFKDPD